MDLLAPAMRRLVALAALGAAIVSAAAAAAAAPAPPRVWRAEAACPFDASRARLPVVCGRLSVPENADAPAGRRIEIAYMVVKARHNIDPRHPVLFLNGGPGETSLAYAELLVASPHVHDVVVDRDWVFFDQRGTGRSVPSLYCPDEDDHPFDLGGCRDDLMRQGIDLSQYNSLRSASDIEALRTALGVEQWNLWGISYGSRLAMVTARRYPASVHAIVHDAAGLPEGQEFIDDARGTEAALLRLFSKCAVDAACAARFPDLRGRLIAALPRLRQQPLQTSDRPYDDREVLRFFRNWFYPRGYSTFERRTQGLLIFLDAAARGDGPLMVATRQRMRQEETAARPAGAAAAEPIHARQSIGQNLSVACNEKRPFETLEDFRRASAESEILRTLLAGAGEPECALWPAGQADPAAIRAGYYDGPQLVFTGELDASSSGLAGYAIAGLYPNARHVVFRNGNHGQVPAELPTADDLPYRMCALRLARQFLADPARPLDTRCAETRRLRLVA